MFLKSRRNFLQKGFLGGSIFVFAQGSLFGSVSPLDTLSVLFQDLLPETKKSPGANENNVLAYISLILHHSRVSQAQKKFIRNGVQWLNEEALSQYKLLYTKLSEPKRQALLKDIAKTGWGESFIFTMLGYGFEAMLGDPVYGVNKNESGWKWLKHKPGLPRPKEALL